MRRAPFSLYASSVSSLNTFSRAAIALRALSVQFGVTLPTAQRTVVRVTKVIIALLGPQHIRWPSHAQCAEHAAAVQDTHSQLPHVAGFVDGTHIKVMPQNAQEKVYSYNRKGFHSIILQGIVDREGRFLNAFVGYLGRVHDARVFCASPIVSAIADVPGHGSALKEPFVLLGDAAYPLTSWLITPYPTEPTLAHKRFNFTHSSARMAVERAFGKLKAQWSILHTNRLYGPQTMVSICIALCILHNITIDVDEDGAWQPPYDALAALIEDDDDRPPQEDALLPGRDQVRNGSDAGKVKRNIMRDNIR
jgi:hypothetical protein